MPLLSACGTSDSEPIIIGTTPDPDPEPEVDKRLSGGATTVFSTTSSAFEQPASNLSAASLERHLAGDVAFEDVFVTAPAPVNSGLGPVFNNSACIRCHPRDGRGRAPEPGAGFDSIFLRISIGNDPTSGPYPVPGFGNQLQHRAVVGVTPEGTIDVRYEDRLVTFADGETLALRKPVFSISGSYIDLPPGVLFGPRLAPPVFGRGLLEAIPEATIVGWADETDLDGDNVSGRPNRVYDPVSRQTSLGRFGLKANAPSLIVQNAGAYNGDIGVTSSVLPVESSFDQAQYDGFDDEVEVSDETLAAVTIYTQTLGVPARRDVDDPTVLRGEQLFEQANCTACHKPQVKTGDFDAVPELADQLIFPYTDLLLHDMGEDLADGRPDFLASGSEWRTPPLWGIGMTETVNGHTDFLHDGRARNLLEAIMWHGGEAEGSKEFVRKLPKGDRDALVRFLNSL
jgi:CxxC motif-containing protein (DUF1111 family)